MIQIFKNKVAVVVGGTKGIGFEIAKSLYEKGSVVFIGGRDQVKAEKSAFEIDKERKRVFGFSVDVGDKEQVSSFIKKIKQQSKRIDFLICAAGIFEPFGEFEKVSFEEHERVLNVNLMGTMRVCYLLLPIMKKQKFGRIILFSGGGVGGDRPLINASSYFVSKGAVAVLAEVLGEETKNYGITVNAVLPGQILTDATKKTFKISDKKLGSVLAKAIDELKKGGGNSVEPVINLINFLLSKEGDSISGRLLSAKWDNLEFFKKISSEQYKLRRVKE